MSKKTDPLDSWNYAGNRGEMPSKSGSYLFMDGLGNFFVGAWDARKRSLHTRSMGCSEDKSRRRSTTGDVKTARWSWKASGPVYWRDVGGLDAYRVWQRVSAKKADAKLGN